MPDVPPDEGEQPAPQVPPHETNASAREVYLPAGQSMHVALAAEVDPTGPDLPAAHAEPEQVEAPDSLEYVPAVQ